MLKKEFHSRKQLIQFVKAKSYLRILEGGWCNLLWAF